MDWVEQHWQVITVMAGIAFHYGQSYRQNRTLGDRVERGMTGIHSRLDTLNGKVFDHEGRLSKVEGEIA